MGYKVQFAKHAIKEFLKLPGDIRDTVIKKLQFLVDDPYAINSNIKKLQGVEGCYRLRVGNYRVIYRIISLTLIIEIIKVGHRQEIYK